MKLEGSCHYGAVATKDHPSADYPYKNADGGNVRRYHQIDFARFQIEHIPDG